MGTCPLSLDSCSAVEFKWVFEFVFLVGDYGCYFEFAIFVSDYGHY